MRLSARPRIALRLAALMLLTVAGCTISIQPWTKPQPPPPSPPTDGMWNPAMMKNGQPQNPVVNNERMSEMIKSLNDEQEMRNALQQRLAQVNKQNKDLENNLQTVSYEMVQSTEQMKKTREEFRHAMAEMEELRERLNKMETTHRLSVKPLIDDIYRHLEREKEPPKLKLVPAPSK